MAYSTAGKNLMLNALKGTNPTTPITHVGLYDESAALTSVTGVATTNLLTKTSHGLTNGDLVVLRALTGGAGLVVERPYYIVGVSGSDFQLAGLSGGSAFDFTTDITSVSVIKLVEISGGSPAYARIAIAFAAAAEGLIDDTTNGAIVNVPAGAVVNYVGFFSAVTAGTLAGISLVTEETFGAQGTYTVTDAKLDLNAVA
jgi:hypothetical protein